MKKLGSNAWMALTAICLAVARPVLADVIVYNNSTVDTGNSIVLSNGFTVGNEILLSQPETISFFSFEIFSPTNAFSGTATVSYWLYQHTGAGGAPGSVLWSGSFSLAAAAAYFTPLYDLSSVQLGYALTVEDAPYVTVPADFTLAVSASGLTGSDAVGLEVFNPITVGNAFNDYWFDDNGGGWVVKNLGAGNNLFGARFYATPEPSTVSLAALGSLFLGAIYRRQRR